MRPLLVVGAMLLWVTGLLAVVLAVVSGVNLIVLTGVSRLFPLVGRRHRPAETTDQSSHKNRDVPRL